MHVHQATQVIVWHNLQLKLFGQSNIEICIGSGLPILSNDLQGTTNVFLLPQCTLDDCWVGHTFINV